jgi:hypothetical protein
VVVEEGRLAYRVRTAEAADAKALREAIGSTLAHPDHQGRRESYSGAASRGDILVLERYDRHTHDWQVAGFVECHMRVDDNLSVRDIGTTGDEPQTGMVRYLLDQAFDSFRPVEAQVKIRRDARVWLDIFRSVPGFHLEGEEYRRPHYWTIWRWDRQSAREASQLRQQPQPQRRPTPPPPPRPPAAPADSQRTAAGRANNNATPLKPRRRGPRPAGPPSPARPAGQRPARRPRRPTRPANPR